MKSIHQIFTEVSAMSGTRILSVSASDPDDMGILFTWRRAKGRLAVLVGVGLGWDHVSVSLQKRAPTWAEMEAVKRLCFTPDEVAFQLHVPPVDHINIHPYTLHMWRSHDAPVPLPPKELI